jgi:Xaa-Pro dipeptidase
LLRELHQDDHCFREQPPSKEEPMDSQRYAWRHERLIEHIRDHNLDALILIPGPNMYYFTGLSFHLSERPIAGIFKRDGQRAVVLPKLEAVKVAHAGAMRVFSYTDEEGHEAAFRQACETLELKEARLGAEGLRMRLVEVKLLERYAPGCRLVMAEDVVADLRMQKDGGELDLMRSAIAVTEKALQSTIKQVEAGITEAEVASLLRIELLRAGGDAMAFPPIVVAGPNAALPHATPSDRPIQAGETIIIDCGASIAGYAADITRTFVIGTLAPELTRVYEVVRAANRAGRSAVRPGVPAEAIDRASREVIDEAGYGEHFIHRTGHGLGLETHEPPYIVTGNRQPLRPGMTFTVEPGVYLSGRGGVRIEDDVLVTEGGVETLSTFTRELITLPG